ncbi:hypothetical protein ACTVH1_16985 [Gluconobacter cerinus]
MQSNVSIIINEVSQVLVVDLDLADDAVSRIESLELENRNGKWMLCNDGQPYADVADGSAALDIITAEDVFITTARQLENGVDPRKIALIYV